MLSTSPFCTQCSRFRTEEKPAAVCLDKLRPAAMVIYADTLPPEVSVIKVPEIRIRRQNGCPVQPDGEFVLNWMIAARRATWNFALQRATEWATELGKPLIVLGGRNPNSYSGIFWCLGRYDRPWGPARPIFGTIRYMSSVNTARKVRVKDFIRRYPL